MWVFLWRAGVCGFGSGERSGVVRDGVIQPIARGENYIYGGAARLEKSCRGWRQFRYLGATPRIRVLLQRSAISRQRRRGVVFRKRRALFPLRAAGAEQLGSVIPAR